MFLSFDSFMSESSCFWLEMFGDIWIDVIIRVEVRVMNAACEHVLHRHDHKASVR